MNIQRLDGACLSTERQELATLSSGTTQNNPPVWWSSPTVRTHVVDLLLAYFACSYYEHMHCVCSEALKGWIPPVEQRSLRQSESALLCYMCRIYLCTWKDHLLQEQPRRIQTTQSAADVNLMKSSDWHRTVKIWDKKKTTTTINNNKNKTHRQTHANCGLVFTELTARAEQGWFQPGVSVSLVQLEYSAVVHIKLKLKRENVFSHLLE